MAFTKYEFTKSWLSSADFPTYEANETKVREDMQVLHDETRDAVHALVDELEDKTAAANIGAEDSNGESIRLQTLLGELIHYTHVDPDALKDENISLSAAVRAALSLADDKPLKDALLKLAEMTQEVRQIGDVLSTARSNLGGDWLPCNGSAVRASDYPELAALLPNPAKVEVGGTGILRLAGDGGGNYVAIGTTTAQMFYADNPAGPWTQIVLTGNTSSIYDVTYADGKWAVLGYDATETKWFVAYAADPSDWTKSFIVLPDGLSTYNPMFTRIGYGDGAWMILGYRAMGWLDLLWSATLGTTWSLETLFDKTGSTAMLMPGGVFHAGGASFAYGCIKETNGDSYAKIYTRQDGSNTWHLSYSTPAQATGSAYYNCAYIVVVGVGAVLAMVSSDLSKAPTNIYFGATPTSLAFKAGFSAGNYSGLEATLGYAGGRWLLTFGTGSLAYSDSADALTWTSESSLGGALHGILTEGDRWMIGAAISSQGYEHTTLATQIPSITTPGVNTYIKAK